jgi:hypothetical protein
VAGFAAKAIPDTVFDLDYAAGVVYAAGEFGKIGTAPPAANLDEVGNAAGFHSTTGAWTGWKADANKKVESIVVAGNSVFIGGNFDTVKGQARDRLARLNVNGNLETTNYGVLAARPFDLAASTDGATLYAAFGPGPAASGTGNRITSFNAVSGAVNFNNNNLKGNGEAVELVGSTLYAGFLGGYDSTTAPLPLNPANYRLLTISGNNQVGTFQPTVAAPSPASGVFDLAQGNGRFVAVGDFTAVGNTPNLRGLAIFV